MTLQSDLIAAKALIDTPEKWGRGAGTWKGTLCALEALRQATHHTGGMSQMPGWRALRDALPDESHFKQQSYVGGYNDDPATTHADIMALFDRAINAAGAK
jgi:hypothetical protein